MKLKIGKRTYSVLHVDTLTPTLIRGRITYDKRTIEIAQRSGRRPAVRSEAGKHHTMWHEAVHGMLYELNSNKYRDEAFVDKLATMIISINKQLADDQRT